MFSNSWSARAFTAALRSPRFFHGYYDCYCYLPLYVFCGDQLLAAKLRPSDIDGAAGSVEEVARIVAQIRQRWPRVRIVLRADSGFARDHLMGWCEANGVDYIFGLARNTRLVAEIADELAQAREESTASGKPARRFKDFVWTTRTSWSRERRVIGNAELDPTHQSRWASVRATIVQTFPLARVCHLV